MTKILVTGAGGFIGKNLIFALKENGFTDILKYDLQNSETDLEEYIAQADFIYHLAGVNRPEHEKEFEDGNYLFTKKITNLLMKYNKATPIVYTSSIQAELSTPYGKSKKQGEDALLEYSRHNSASVYLFQLPNVFGKWCRPNYNSAIATFCSNIARDLPISISNRDNLVKLVYIDDVVSAFIYALTTSHKLVNVDGTSNYFAVNPVFTHSLGEIVDLIYLFKRISTTKTIPDLNNLFTKYLYSVYLSYLPEDVIINDLDLKTDSRGTLFELIKSDYLGQIFVSTTKPGITRGNHYHHTKIEKFCVIQGKASIKLRHIYLNETVEYAVDGVNPKTVDIPPGWTHNITNIGENDLITIFWSNEIFNQEKPDTHFEEV